jgi:hypothetical protein
MRTIEEKNRLIAEFMGVKTEKFASGILNFMYEVNGNNEGFEVGELSYHTSWDWLMPVLKKISQTLFSEHASCIKEQWLMIERPTNYPIENVHNQVCQFIEWYNEQKF